MNVRSRSAAGNIEVEIVSRLQRCREGCHYRVRLTATAAQILDDGTLLELDNEIVTQTDEYETPEQAYQASDVLCALFEIEVLPQLLNKRRLNLN